MTAPDFFSDLEETPLTTQSMTQAMSQSLDNTPDFFSDLEPSQEQPSVGKITPFQQQISQPTSGMAPDFFAELEGGETQKPISTPYDVPEYTPEQLKKMPVSERLQYAKDLVIEREYRQSRGVTKGLISGATLGLSEKIPGLKPAEGEFLTGFGEFLGSTLPINKLYNILGKPLVSIAAQSPKYAKALQSFARMTGFGLTGAAYEGAKETIKTGEVPTAQELLKYGAQWAVFDSALQVLGHGASFLSQLRRYSQANNIPEKEALNTIVDTLAREKINAATNPEEAVRRAEELLNAEPGAKKPEKLIEAEAEKIPEKAEIRVEAKPLAIQKAKEPIEKQAAPITEETGQGAGERIQYAPAGFDKVVDKTNEFIKAAKTPAESLKRLGQATNEGIFDALAPLERIETETPVAERVTTKIRLAQSVASEIDSVLENGIFSNMTGNFEHEGLKGAYGDLTWKKFTKGMKPEEFSLEELDTYRVSKSALRRQAEGKKTGVDTQQAIKDINRLQKKYEPVDKRIRDFQKATLEHYGKDLLGADLINKWNQKYYAPLFRVMDSGKDSILKTGALKPKQPFKKFEGSERRIIAPSESDPYNASMLISNARKNESILQYRKMVEQGKLPGKIMEGKNKPIPEQVLEDLEIDPDLKNVAETLYNQTRKDAYTPEKNVLRGWKNGKPFQILVPEEIYNVFSSIAPQDRSPISKMFSFVNRMFSKGISMEPRKFLSIAGRDALSSLVYSKTGSNPISIAEALGDILGGKQVYKEFLSMGGDVYAARLAERIDRSKKIEDLITPGKEGILVPFEKMGEYFRKYGRTLGDISLSVPLAEYKRALEVYGNTAEGRIMAAMEARRVTYDPTRKGSWTAVRELGNFIPFWNVSLQDMAMVGRNLKSPETWVKGFTAITMPTLLLKMANEGNPDYEDLTPVDKAAFWHVYFGDKHLRIPIPWLLGTAFKVSAEAFYDTVSDLKRKGDPRAKDAWEGLYGNFVENLSGDLPPLLQNFIEMSTGKSAPSPLGLALRTESRAPEIVPRRLQDLPSELQYTSKTSQIARKFGKLWDISPVKIDRTIKNFGTQVAADVLALTDEIAYATGMAEDKRPAQREANYLLLGHFLSTSPSRTKYANEFYEYLREATKNKNAQKIIREKGITDSELNTIKYEGTPIFAYNLLISKMFKQMRTDEDDSSLTPAQKKQKLDGLQREINDLYKKAVQGVRKSQES